MATNAPGVTNLTLQKLVDILIESTQLPDGTFPDAAPDAFKDRLGAQLTTEDTTQFELIVGINIDGASAFCKVRPLGSKANAITGLLDTTILATKLV